MRGASPGYADNTGRGAVVGNSELAAQTPVVVGRFEGHVQRLGALVASAQAAAALVFAAAVVVRDDVVMPVFRIVTSPHPRDGGLLGARWAAVYRASAAATKETVYGAVSPVLAGVRVTG